MSGRKHRFSPEQVNYLGLILMLYDIAAVNGAYFLALWLRFDCRYSMIPERYLKPWIYFVPVYTIFCLLVFHALRLYKSLWRYASVNELSRIMVSTAITGLFHAGMITLLFHRMPIFYYIIGCGIQFVLIVGSRFSYRIFLAERSRVQNSFAQSGNIMLIGAGDAGQMILRDLRRTGKPEDQVCCIIDDDEKKSGRYIGDVPIVGGRDDILLNVEKYHVKRIYLAIPGATAEQRRDILDICKETDCELKNLPGISRYLEGEVTVSSLKDVELEDLLGREPITVNMDEIYRSLEGKTILVTGGGGSIGSELCRQIAKHNPKRLIVFDIYENNAYEIEQELRDTFPYLELTVLIGSVRDSRRIFQVFGEYRPDIVYHAAAHKHVPLMETSLCEAIKNNAIGTYKTAYAAMMNNCRRFVLISTDKAVNPTNIMGASKRICEMIIQTFSHMIRMKRTDELPPLAIHAGEEYGSLRSVIRAEEGFCTEFVAVRFGNVLGSNGSVVPRFKKQIAQGGPVTVTHPDIIRYFMTIPEAASLVLQAGTYAKGGEIFVLDMGTPVRIDSLARNLIRLSGLRPDVDIRITYTGLRPGEKLYEEKLMSEEGMRTTPNRLIHIGSPIPLDTDRFLKQLRALIDASYDGNEPLVRKLVTEMVPTYHANRD